MVDVRSQETLKKYSDVVNFMLITFLTDEVVADAYVDVTHYRQYSSMSDTEFAYKICDKEIRCVKVFSDRRV